MYPSRVTQIAETTCTKYGTQHRNTVLQGSGPRGAPVCPLDAAARVFTDLMLSTR